MCKIKLIILNLAIIFLLPSILNARISREYNDIDELIRQYITTVDGHIDIIETYYNLILSRLPYESFIKVLRYLNEAVLDYYHRVYFGNAIVEIRENEQKVLSDVAVTMLDIIGQEYNPYARALSADILNNCVLLLSNDVSADKLRLKLRDSLVSMLDSKDSYTRYYATICLGNLAIASWDPAMQDELVLDIASMLEDRDSFIYKVAIKILQDVLTSIEVSHDVRKIVIEALIKQYARFNATPTSALKSILGTNPNIRDDIVPDSLVDFYLSQNVQPEVYLLEYNLVRVLKLVTKSDAHVWRQAIDEILKKHHLTNREGILEDIFRIE